MKESVKLKLSPPWITYFNEIKALIISAETSSLFTLPREPPLDAVSESSEFSSNCYQLLLVCTNNATNSLVGNVQRVSDFRFLFTFGMQTDCLLLDGSPGLW